MEEKRSGISVFDWCMIWSLTLTVLKVTDVIDAPWWKVFSPMWALFAVAFVIGLIGAIGGGK